MATILGFFASVGQLMELMHLRNATVCVFKVLHFSKLLLSMAVLSVALVSCYESGSEQVPPPPVTTGGGNTPAPGIAANGKIFYRQNCSVCHSAGNDDTTSAFGAINLANQNSRISTDISHFDTTYNMMARFTSIDQARVDDLKKYLAGL